MSYELLHIAGGGYVYAHLGSADPSSPGRHPGTPGRENMSRVADQVFRHFSTAALPPLLCRGIVRVCYIIRSCRHRTTTVRVRALPLLSGCSRYAGVDQSMSRADILGRSR